MEHRVEKKYLVTDLELEVLASKLQVLMKKDVNQNGDAYVIRSLYFDDYFDTGMEENESGVDERRKYRIRTYTHDAKKMYLECKEKQRGYTKKQRSVITRDECIAFMQGRTFNFDRRNVFNALILQMKTMLLKPKVIIEYERCAFVHPLGNVRITFDQNIMASKCCNQFLCERIAQRIPLLPKGQHILEVKYDEYLPETIAQLLEDGNLKQIAFSKYYIGRKAIDGEFIY